MVEIAEVEVARIKPSGINPREAPDPQKMAELVQSMKEVGLIQPILVRKKDEIYQVIIGERRAKAAEKAGLKKLPAIIRDVTDDEAIEMMLIENVQREDLSDVEKGKAAKELLEKFLKKYPSQSVLAQRLGIDRTSVGRWIQTVEIVPREVRRLIAPAEPASGKIPKGKISGDLAVTIARKVTDKEKQVELAREIVQRGIPKPTVRKIVTRVALEPRKSVKQVFKEVVEEAPLELPFRLTHAKPIIEGTKTQTSRHLRPEDLARLKVGTICHANIWEPRFADLKVREATKKRLGDFTEQDAKREGGYTLEEFKNIWESIHGKGSWKPDVKVDVIVFELVKSYPIEGLK